MEPISEELSKKLEEISKKLGIPVNKLLENKSAQKIVEEFEKGILSILND